jgi:hypothetical protein
MWTTFGSVFRARPRSNANISEMANLYREIEAQSSGCYSRNPTIQGAQLISAFCRKGQCHEPDYFDENTLVRQHACRGNPG